MREIETQVIQYQQEEFGGLKSIAFASKTVDNWRGDFDFEQGDNRGWLEGELTYIATLGLSDPIRDDVSEAINKLDESQTYVRILSGDHRLAVMACAEKL